jgi:hypothetical protein
MFGEFIFWKPICPARFIALAKSFFLAPLTLTRSPQGEREKRKKLLAIYIAPSPVLGEGWGRG